MTEIRVPYPFVKMLGEALPDDPEATRAVKVVFWRPGVTIERTGEYESSAWADAEGFMALHELSRHKPSPRHMERVFYLRHFIDPDGNAMSKPKLMMTTAAGFMRLQKGYRYHYDLP